MQNEDYSLLRQLY